MRKFTVAIIICTIAILGGGTFIALHHFSQSKTQTKANESATTSRSATITFDGDSFEPETSTVAAGGIVKVVNQSSTELDFESNPHPSHTGNQEINLGDVAPGVSRSFTVHTKGTWGFHNHVSSSQRGTIIVQ